MNKLLNNISFRNKILGNSAVLLLLLLVCSGYSLYSLKSVGLELAGISELDFPLYQKLTAITEARLEQGRHFERALRFGGLSMINPEAAKKMQQEIKASGRLSEKVGELLSQIDEQMQYAVEVAKTEEERETFGNIARELTELEAELADVEGLTGQAFQLISNGEYRKSLEVATQIEPGAEQLDTRLLNLKNVIEQFTEKATLDAEQHEQHALKILTLTVLVSIALGVLIAWSIASNLTRRLSTAMEHLGVVASGDLTREVIIDGSDEIGRCQESILLMQQNLVDLLGAISETSESLATAAEQVSATMLQTAANIQEQQKETEQVSVSMNDISQAVAEVSGSASDAASATRNTNDETRKGQQLVETTVTGIKQLSLQVEDTATQISELERDSHDIYAVLDVIKSVAEQTNLLALNAAIEAARAGDHGRGFAVVADEVRTLAGRTQDSTEEINQIIEKFQSGTKKATDAMQRSREQTSTVVEKATQAGASLDTIAESVSQIDEKNTHIASTANQQDLVTNNMSENISHINEVAMHNAASIEETTVASQEIARSAEELAARISRFKVR